MLNAFLASSKYIMILLMGIYTFSCFTALNAKTDEKEDRIFKRQNAMTYLLHFIGYLVIYINEQEDKIILFYGAQLIFFVIVLGILPIIYSKLNKALLSNMCMLLAIGFIEIARLDYNKCVKQFEIVAAAALLTVIVPLIISKLGFLQKLTWVYGILGMGLLVVVLVGGFLSYGAKLSINIGSFTIQPSEFVKILFVFFIAGMLAKSTEFAHIVTTTVCAAVYVVVLVISKDLGSALIFFVVYLFMLYAATSKKIYFLSGFLAGSAAAVVAYKLFSHVQVRVAAWLDPWTIIDGDGYQVAQSLFAIGAGGWLGTGLYKGMPTKIPVVVKDFIFSSIAEEMGGVFVMLLIMVCLSCFIAYIRTSVNQTNLFYKLVAYGLGIAYAVQVILTIGGAIKMIPSTGVTLPLVSYGGSSALSTMIIFSIIQGLNVLAKEEQEAKEEIRIEREKREAYERKQNAIRQKSTQQRKNRRTDYQETVPETRRNQRQKTITKEEFRRQIREQERRGR